MAPLVVSTAKPDHHACRIGVLLRAWQNREAHNVVLVSTLRLVLMRCATSYYTTTSPGASCSPEDACFMSSSQIASIIPSVVDAQCACALQLFKWTTPKVVGEDRRSKNNV